MAGRLAGNGGWGKGLKKCKNGLTLSFIVSRYVLITWTKGKDVSRVFISFAIEDKGLRNLLVGQKQNSNNDIEFIDYSVKQPWDNAWKTNCKARIRTCSKMIGIITHNTPSASGQLWELGCANQLGVPLLLIHGYSGILNRISSSPAEIRGRRIHEWNQQTIINFLNR